MKLSEHQKGLLLIFISAILWSTGGIFIKLLTLNPFQISFFRSIFAALTIVAILRKKALIFNLGTFINGLFYAAILILFVIATKTTTAANAIFLQYTAPIYVFIFEPILLHTKFERINLITIIICIIGMLLFFIGELSPGHLIGNIFALLSGISFAAFLLGMRLNKPEYQYPTIFVGNIFVVLFTSFSIFSLQKFSTIDFLMVSYLGIFQIGLPYIIFSLALKKVYAIEASLLSMIEPVLNPVWVYLGYGESPSMFAIIGGIIIIIVTSLRALVLDKFILKSKKIKGIEEEKLFP